jgi:hypothetical protein
VLVQLTKRVGVSGLGQLDQRNDPRVEPGLMSGVDPPAAALRTWADGLAPGRPPRRQRVATGPRAPSGPVNLLHVADLHFAEASTRTVRRDIRLNPGAPDNRSGD